MRKIILILFTTIFITSCENTFSTPKPDAKFNFTYLNDGKVLFSNISDNGDTYFWNFGDGSSSTEHSPTYTYKRNGNYDVTLRATGKGGESTITRTLNINSIPTTGNLVFWTTISNHSNIKIYVSGTYRGLITKYRTQASAPACGTEGFVTVNLPQGVYNYKAEEDSFFGSSWSGQIDIRNGQCSSMRLTK